MSIVHLPLALGQLYACPYLSTDISRINDCALVYWLQKPFALSLSPLRKQKLFHLHMHLVMASKCIVKMRGEEGKRQIFTWGAFKKAGENTKYAKYNSPEGYKCLCITQISIAMQTLYTT